MQRNDFNIIITFKMETFLKLIFSHVLVISFYADFIILILHQSRYLFLH